MKRSVLPTILPLLFLILSGTVSAQPTLMVRSAHEQDVTFLTQDPATGYLYSGGREGTIMVWDPGRDLLLQRIHADVLPIVSITPYPDGQQIVVYASDGRNHRISVWNWRAGSRTFLHVPTDEVLHLDVSSQGTYLVYTVPQRQSIRVLDGSTGRALPFLRDSSGIVSWFVIARSEERLMSYTPATGEIIYRSIVTGRVDGRFTAPAGINDLVILPSPRFAAGKTADGLLSVVDLLSGEILADTAAGEIQKIYLDRQTEEIIVVSRDYDGSSTVRNFRFQESSTAGGTETWTVQRRYAPRRDLPPESSVYLFSGRDLFANGNNGTILHWLPFEIQPSILASSQIDQALDFMVSEQSVHLLAADRILTVTSDFFDPRVELPEVQYVRDRTTLVPWPALRDDLLPRFIAENATSSYLWAPISGENAVRQFRAQTGQLIPTPVTPAESLRSVDVENSSILLLTRSGSVLLHDGRTGEQYFSYRGRGLQTAILTGRGVFLGKAADGLFDSAVLRVNVNTRETVSLATDSDLVFSLNYDERRGRLFAIGVHSKQDGTISTVLEVFEGSEFQRRRTILEIPGEYLEAMVTVDPVTGNAYTTLDDRGGVLRWDGSRITELQRNPAHIPSRIALDGRYLYSVNQDGTLSITDRFDGTTIVDIYLIAGAGSGAWIAIRPDGRYFVSSGFLATSRYLSLNDPAEDLQSLRLSLPEYPDQAPQVPAPRNRFDTGEPRQSPTEQFDPFSGAPAPSS